MANGDSQEKTELLCGFHKKDLKKFHTGKIAPYVFPVDYQKAHKEDIPHIIVRIFLKTSEGNYIVQKRSQSKKRHKGRWTDSASGHVRYNDDFKYEDIEQNVKREVHEELGCQIAAIRFCEFSLDEFNEDCYELAYIYVGLVNDKIRINNDEVSEETRAYSKEELRELLKIPRTEKGKPWVETTREFWKKIISGRYDKLFDQMNKEIKEIEDLNENKLEENTTQTQKNTKKKYKIGLIIGRFQPVHKGHVGLIRECLKYIEKLKILIGSSQFSDKYNDPFSYDERKLMIDLALSDIDIHPNSYEVIPVPDQFNFKKWIQKVVEKGGEFDILFTNNLWIGRLFQLRNKQVKTGLEFEIEKYNGTRIRELIYNKKPQWIDLIPSSVYRYISQPEILNRLKDIGRKKKNM
ncbi:MAG: nicotinamide-nucleotide adenylyltransferase [Candidatus Lokiarchaeota archaeon]|nr:nicotinamide-nucleotide adenylyltransferase [Candidatus Lokiarchaeota archaeon]